MVGETVFEVSHSLTLVLFEASQTQVRNLTQHVGPQSIVSYPLVLVHRKFFHCKKRKDGICRLFLILHTILVC